MTKKKKLDTPKKPHTVRFDQGNGSAFYEDEAVLPAAAFWNLDEFLAGYMIAGINALLTGHTDWDSLQDAAGRNTRKQLIRARDLFQEYLTTLNTIGETKKPEAGNTALRILADIGIQHLWD